MTDQLNILPNTFFSLGSKLRLFLHIKENLGKKLFRSRKNNFV